MQAGDVCPLFVVGAGRSGTTAMCKALHCHSQILVAPGESPMVHEVGLLAENYRAGGGYYKDSTAVTDESVGRMLRSFCLACVWGDPEPAMLDRIESMSMDCGAGKDLENIHYWGAKAFPDLSSGRGLEWLFPQARFIHIFRNGIDVVHSMSKFHGFCMMSFEERCRFWSRNALRYKWLRGHDQAVEIRFEDFVCDPGTALKRIFNLAHLQCESEPERFAGSTLIHPLDQATIAASPRSVLAQRARAYEHWSQSERQTFRDICSDAMAYFEYPVPF